MPQGESGIHSRLFFCYNSKVDSEAQKPDSKRSLLVAIFDECYNGEVLGHAAQLAFYFLFALFPMLIFLAALVGYLPIPQLLDRMIDYLSQVLPTTAIVLVRQTLLEVTRKQRGGLLSFGLIVTVWAASSGLHALINSLNVAYSVKTMRAWWKDRLLAIALTFAFSILIIVALAIIFFGGNLGTLLANEYNLGRMFRTGWALLQWPTMVLFLLFGLELVYYCAPNRPMKWRWLTPGAIFALLIVPALGFVIAFSYSENLKNLRAISDNFFDSARDDSIPMSHCLIPWSRLCVLARRSLDRVWNFPLRDRG